MSFMQPWNCNVQPNYEEELRGKDEKAIKIEKNTLLFLRKAAVHSKIEENKVEDGIINSKFTKKKFLLINSLTNKGILLKPMFDNVDIANISNNVEFPNKFEVAITKEKLKIKQKNIDYIKNVSGKPVKPNLKQMSLKHKNLNYYLMQSFFTKTLMPKKKWEHWKITGNFKYILDNKETLLPNDYFASMSKSNNADTKKYLKSKLTLTQSMLLVNRPLTTPYFKPSFLEWAEPDVNDINLDLVKFSEQINNRIFYCKKLKSLPDFHLQSKFRKLLMWEIDNRMLKSMVWKVFTFDPRANYLLNENNPSLEMPTIENVAKKFEYKSSLEYIFPNNLTFRLPLQELKSEENQVIIKIPKIKRQKEKTDIKESRNSTEGSEFDSLVLNKRLFNQKEPEKSNFTENTNVAVNESTFYFDNHSITHSRFVNENKFDSNAGRAHTVFCNFSTLNKNILQKLHQSNKLNVVEGETREFANLQCQIILNQKSCIRFINCTDFFQMNPKTKQLYIYVEIMQLCENFENIYFIFTDTEDQSIENIQRCKLAILENFQPFSNVYIFDIESSYYENEFTAEVLVPLILQNSQDSDAIFTNDLNENGEVIYELLALGFDLFTANILSSIDDLINKAISGALTKQDMTVITKRIAERIVRTVHI